jgi:hypothetical protein
LEYLLFKGGIFKMVVTNICESHICYNHLEVLSSQEENKGRCKACKPVCKRPTSNNKGDRRISKALALAIWEHGQPQENWTLYDQSICDQCRKYLTNNIVTDELCCKCEHIFGDI